MPCCDICGKETELYHALIEGTEMNVCIECGKFGKIIKKAREYKEKPKKIIKDFSELHQNPDKEIVQVIVKDYAQRIKNKREQFGLKQEDFAKKISEKESLIHHIESGTFEPNINLARKMEKFLKIKLVEEEEVAKDMHFKASPEQFTVGDFIKVRKKKGTNDEEM